MIGGLLPAGAVAVQAFDDAEPAALFPAEEELVRGAVDKRRREFATGRRCAREALAALGIPPLPLLPGRGGALDWPAGVVGSITHCAGYRAAAVARAADLVTVGIDAEPNQPLPAGVLAAVTVGGEPDAVAGLLREEPAVRWDRLLFSAKESVYKAWFPLTGRWLGFQDVAVTFDPATATFGARLLAGEAPAGARVLAGFSGRWTARRGLVLTAVTSAPRRA